MPSMRHPYANTRYLSQSLSTDALDSWLQLTPDTEAAPEQLRAMPQLHRTGSSYMSAPSDRSSDGLPRVDVCMSSFASESSGHFVKHSSSATLLLSGQEDGRSEAEYTNGATIEGILAVPRPSGLLSLQVRVEGSMKLQETAGSGSSALQIINDLAFEWDAEHNATFPSKVTFRYTLPTHYSHDLTGERFRLPPSYRAHLSGVPGLRVDISYAVAVYITRNRSKANWWRKSTSLRVPFTYRELSRPTLAGPFVANLTKTPTIPRTVFRYTAESRRNSWDDIKVELYLPHSQICSMCDLIPFSVTFFAPEEVLCRYTTFRPSPESFHPLASPVADSANYVPGQLFSCFMPCPSPVRLQLLRRTTVDVLAAGVYAAPKERTDITTTKVLASGIVYSASRGMNSAVWSGHVIVPNKVGCGGFVAKGIRVTDCLVLTLAHPSSLRNEYAEFYQSVPIRLTTQTYDRSDGVLTISDWSTL
ncbi:uncharacterized protein PHACADRAFT_261996 [Phanerochaete carnosa HHB-10118-sp]|uniref:Arrestin-like N-terminal domain-containing protein n=1 Tax=Phanerochaete carnosa (strain HHB-10118-sp) TaxID=650164 RepID=K5VYL1_PHACS|nr:uncharacterized protein PHACADRAFT_261996 [Phanerochaete carnosa HHB-10118-sp]EKM51699.1 hypothetical protein PHACADRAFT_261996 [Phanerochaete carnosa HHB-10118-sp]